MGIGIMSGFLIIIFLCGILIWTIRSVRVEPYILSTGGINDEWSVIQSSNSRPTIEMTSGQVIQQSLVWKFVQDWFSISNDNNINTELWDSSCKRTDCNTSDASHPCKILCASSDDLFRRFKEDVLPTYKQRVNAGEYWLPIANSIHIAPVGRVTDAGGTWRIEMSVGTSTGDTVKIMAYAKIAKSGKYHDSTMGYYITDFNAYRVN